MFARALLLVLATLAMSLPAAEASAQGIPCEVVPQFCFEQEYPLRIEVVGAGSGAILVLPAFGGDPIYICTREQGSCEFTVEGPVALQAVADTGSEFLGFEGCQQFEETVCGYFPPITGVHTVMATFGIDVPTLTVETAGDGGGTVTSSDDGINCPGDCKQDYAEPAEVTLTAAPDAASEFTGWSGACSGLDPCTLDMDESRNVTATFDSNELRVYKTGSGTGYVGSGDGGIDCGNDCQDHYASGTVVSLTATADPESEFAQFLSGCGAICDVTMTGDQSETAVFVAKGPEGTHGLEADTDGSGEVS